MPHFPAVSRSRSVASLQKEMGVATEGQGEFGQADRMSPNHNQLTSSCLGRFGFAEHGAANDNFLIRPVDFVNHFDIRLANRSAPLIDKARTFPPSLRAGPAPTGSRASAHSIAHHG